MGFRNRNAIYAVALLLAVWPYATAAAADTESNDPVQAAPVITLNTSLSTDSSHNRDYQLDGTFAVSDATRYSFLYEYTYSPSSQTSLLTHTYSLGVDQVISPAFGIGATVQRQGNPDTLSSDELDGSLYWQDADWQITALPSFRHMSLNAQPGRVTGLPIGLSTTLSDSPLGLRVDFSGLQNWLLELSTTRHNYSRDPVILNKLDSLQRFSGSILTRSQGVLSHSSSARIERDFAAAALAFDYQIDRSALAAASSYTSDLDFTTPLSASFDIGITAGVTRSTNLPSSRFVTLNFTYHQ